MSERGELSILEAPGSETERPKVWRGGAVAAVLLVALTMAVLGVVVVALRGASLLLSWFGVPHEPIR